jgi:hypothetical protein
MNCAWYQRWLLASVDDELTGWRDFLLRRHLAGCARCNAESAELRRVRELVAEQKVRYVAPLDDRLFWQQLRPRLQSPPFPDAEPRGVAFFGLFPARQLAFAAVAVALLVAVLIGVRSIRVGSDSLQLAAEAPLLPPPGGGKVEFSDLKHTKGISASVVRFNKPDVDIAVIWVDGLPHLGKNLNLASEEL